MMHGNRIFLSALVIIVGVGLILSADGCLLWMMNNDSYEVSCFITEVENLVDKKVKIIRCDNGTEFKNRVMSEFCEKKGIKKEFSAEAVNTACYVQNRVLVVKPHNKTPYELFRGKFDEKSDEGFFVGYSMNSKAFRVYNIRTRKVEENLHIRFLEDKPIIAGDGPKWLFDIDVLTKSMNYVPVVAGTNSNDFVGTEESIGAGHSRKETRSSQDYILMPLWKDGSLFDSSSKNASNDKPQPPSDAGKKDDEGVCKESGIDDQERSENSTQDVNTVGPSINIEPDMFSLGDNAILEATHADFFVLESPKKVIPAIKGSKLDRSSKKSFFANQVTTVLDLCGFTHMQKSLCTKMVYRNKKDERGIVIRNKARLVAHGYTQEEGIDYNEVFALVSRIEAIRLFLAYASFKDFVVYQMNVKSAFLYGKEMKDESLCLSTV
ncbi:putative ribonuclease H-like domain-containing protein [Tanacetum coccineum]